MTRDVVVHLLRHAHSSHAVAGERDHRRGLSRRGEQEVARVRARLDREPVVLDRIVCSTARRARLTLEPLLPALCPVPLRYDDDLYALGAQAYEAAVRPGEDAERILLVGHNPTIEALVRRWCPRDANAAPDGVGTAYWITIHLRADPDGSLRDARLAGIAPPT